MPTDAAALPEISAIEARLQTGDIDGAVQLAREAYINEVEHPLVLSLMAHRLEEQGKLEDAVQMYIRAAMLTPDDPLIHTNIGHVLVKMSRPTQALEAFNKALAIDPRLPRAHHGAGLALWGMGQLEASVKAQEHAHRLDPDYPDAMGALALAALHMKQNDRAMLFADLALRLDEDEPAAVLVRARVLLDTEQYAECVAYLEPRLASPRLAPLQISQLARIQADALDALADYGAAIGRYDLANRLLNETYAPIYAGPEIETASQLCDRLERFFMASGGAIAAPAEPPPGPPMKAHVFLMGFPRTGTTLLEQVLAGHGEIAALEEKPTLTEAIIRFFISTDNVDELLNATEAELNHFRQLYWSHVASHGIAVEGKVFIDKQPSLTLYIPMLKRLFPDAKIIFSIRDPRDVVLSCYRRAFSMNSTVYEFTRLDTLSTYYAKAMQLGELFLDRIDIDVYRHKHEAFVADFDGQVRDLCRFLGVPFDANMENFVETAKGRDVRTPSALQVLRGLNTSGIGHWRHYSDALAPHAATLAPWVERLGYTAD